MFPNGWPGRGLLLLRLSNSGLVIYQAVAQIGTPHSALTMLLASSVLAGVLLLAGLWTPIVGALLAALEIAIFFWGPDRPENALFSAAVALSIAMLGPGVWSVDAALFGRHRLEFPQD